MKPTSTNAPETSLLARNRGAATRLSLAVGGLLLLSGLTGCAGVISSKSSAPSTTSSNPPPGASALTANPASLSFGDVVLGSDATQTSTLTNTGSGDVTVSGVTSSGPAFMVSGVPGGTTLSSGQSAELTVTFRPTASGNATGSITVSSNASYSPTITLSGGSPSPHSVALTWGASSSPVVGYYVYRGSAINGPYAKLNLVAGTQFTDLSVQAGQTYTYVVTALDGNILESSFSNPATTTVPTP
jgi:hypothetical protein